MGPEHAAANDDGVSYEDGDVVHGGDPRKGAEAPPSKRRRVVGRRILSPLLCDVEEVQIFTNSAPETSTEHARIKDCDDAEQIGRVLSDVHKYLGSEYPKYRS